MNDFESRLWAQFQLLHTSKTFYMAQLSPKKCRHNTKFSVQLPYTASPLPLNLSNEYLPLLHGPTHCFEESRKGFQVRSSR